MERIGLFGGSFNPLHVGHINSVTSVARTIGLQKIYVIPTFQNPMKHPIEGPTPEQRLEMVEIGLKEYEPLVRVDAQEVQRKGKSFTIDTLRAYTDKQKPEDLFLIIGVDVFYELDDWKDVDEILKMVNLVVTTRPGTRLPISKDEFPQAVQKVLSDYDRGVAMLETGRFIQFVRLDDIDVSASTVRKKIRQGQKVDRFLTHEVEEYIKARRLYHPQGDKVADYGEFSKFCAKFLEGKKATRIGVYDLNGLGAPSDYTVIGSGTSTRHCTSLANALMEAVQDEYSILPIHIDGLREGRWVVLDYGSALIHLFYDYVREEYSLEELWKNGKRLV